MEKQVSKILPGSIPKYRQLLIILRNRILGGSIAPGEQIPSEEDLISVYGLSRGTVRKAIAQLEAEKLIETEHGIGSFVRALHPNAIPFRFLKARTKGHKRTGSGDAAGGQGEVQDPEAEILCQELIPAPLDVAERLKLPLGAMVIHVARRKRSGTETISYSERYMPQDVLPGLVAEDLAHVDSIHDLLVRTSDYPLLKAEIEIEAHLLNEEEAKLLGCRANEPAIVVNRMTYTAPNRPAVWYYGLFRKRYELGVEIQQ